MATETLDIERIEPPFWWVGMRTGALELMVHGEGVAAWVPAIEDPSIGIAEIASCGNPNYLFISLLLSPEARPGTATIMFRKGDTQIPVDYELRPRVPEQQRRYGLDGKDVILNLMPDRFSNGNPEIDRVAGFHEAVERDNIACGRHGGDLQGIIGQLDYIADMGYTAIWMTPLTESNQERYSYHGYAATDTYRVDPRFGTNDDYVRLTTLARAKGIGIIHDVVLNHIGSEHWWMRDLPAPDWVTHRGSFTPTNHAHTTPNDPYASSADRESYIAGWFDTCMPDMNHRNPHVATDQIQNTIWWVEFLGLAAIRVDTYGYSDPEFLAAWSRRLTTDYPELGMIGETWSSNPVTIAYWLNGTRNSNGYVSHLPSAMDYPLSNLLRKVLTAEDSLHSGLFQLYEGLTNDVLYPDPAMMILFEGNHDIPRLFSMLGEDFDLYRMALVYLLTIRRIPQLYYGTEILMTSPLVRDDGAFRQDFPGGWQGDSVNARTGEGLSSRQREAQAFVRKLLNWRKRQPVIHHGKLMHFAPDYGSYVYFRYDAHALVMVVLNKNPDPHRLDTARFREVLPSKRRATDVLSGATYDLSDELVVPARSALLLEVDMAGMEP